MNIKREKNNFFKGYDYEIIDKDKKLRIIYAGNLDLYFVLVFNNEIPYGESATRSIKITKENYELYKIFDDLYEEVTNGKIFEDEEASNSISDYLSQRDLVDSNNNICWISDEGPREVEDSMTISKKEDAYNISFPASALNVFTSKQIAETNLLYSDGINIPIRFRPYLNN